MPIIKVPTPSIVAGVVPALNTPEIPVIVNCVTVIGAPSGSLSFNKTSPEIGLSSSVTLLSSLTVIGLSLTGVIVIVKVLETVAPVAAPLLSSVIV